MNRSINVALAAAVFAAAPVSQLIAQPQPTRVIALTGQPVPGVSNRNYQQLGMPVVGTTGQVWYCTSMSGPGAGPSGGLCRADAGGAASSVLLQGASAAAFGNNYVWGGFPTATVLAAGSANELAFLGGVSDGVTSISGVCFYDQAGVTIRPRIGGQDAAGANNPFGMFLSLACAPGGKLAIKANLSGAPAGANTGIWTSNLASLTYRALEGQPAAGIPGVNWGDFETWVTPNITPFLFPAINASQTTTFKADLAGPGVVTGNNEGLWLARAGDAAELIAREGDPVTAAGAPAGATWLMFDRPVINAAGTIVFAAMMTGGGTTGANDEAIFVRDPATGALSILMRENDPAPGLTGLFVHERDSLLKTFRSVVINNGGSVAFVTGIASAAGITNSNDGLAYVYLPSPGPGWVLLGREGNAAPGAGMSDVYGNFNEIALNSRGDVAFINALNGTFRAIFAGPIGMHGLVVRRGGPIQLSPTDIRTVSTNTSEPRITLGTGGGDGLPACLSNLGTLVFQALLTDGNTGVFECLLSPVIQPPGDRDGDGLRDDWEAGEVDINEDGTPDMPLHLLGANPDHKDLFIEVDVEDGMPSQQDALDLVVAAFADAPLTNPDGVNGVTVHFFVDDTDVPSPTGGPWFVAGVNFPVGFQAAQASYFGTVGERTDNVNGLNRLEARRVFRWALIVNDISPRDYSGYAEIDGNEGVWVLGWDYPFAEPSSRAGTIMHEIGHWLGLRHGGGDSVNYKPNYPSIMNYGLQVRYEYCRYWRRLDYSREALPTLDEANLNENIGVGVVNSLYSGAFKMPIGLTNSEGIRRRSTTRLNGAPRDLGSTDLSFHWDGFITASAHQDLNWWTDTQIVGQGVSTYPEVMVGYDDWAHVQLRLGNGGSYAAGALIPPTEPELNEASGLWINANILPDCLADFNGDGARTVTDIFAMLSAWFAHDPRAEFDGVPGFGVADIFAFLRVWFVGCP